jgi:serine/threonine-protein kinase RsbW
MPLKKIGELVIPSNQDYLAKVDRFAEAHLKKLKLSRSDRDDVAIALSEAVNNAIVHGNHRDEAKKVTIRLYHTSRYLRIIVIDEGDGFLPSEIPDPRADENLLKASGRGLLIMRHLMDRVSFKPGKKGLQITLDKFYGKGP